MAGVPQTAARRRRHVVGAGLGAGVVAGLGAGVVAGLGAGVAGARGAVGRHLAHRGDARPSRKRSAGTP